MGGGSSSVLGSTVCHEVLATVKDLQFIDSERSRGASLLFLKDQLLAYEALFQAISARFGCTCLKGFLAAVKGMGLGGSDEDDLDIIAITGIFFETCGFPEDEDDSAQCNAIPMSLAQLGAAFTRVRQILHL